MDRARIHERLRRISDADEMPGTRERFEPAFLTTEKRPLDFLGVAQG